MTLLYFVILVAAAILAFVLGRSRAYGLADANGRISHLHSLPGYHGGYAALCVALPVLALFCIWLYAAPYVIEAQVTARAGESFTKLTDIERVGFMRDIRALAFGGIAGAASPAKTAAAANLAQFTRWSTWGLGAAMALTALAGLMFGTSRIAPAFRARNAVERVIVAGLLICSIIAVLTTVGIVFSVLFETLSFFTRYPAQDFFFGTNWKPDGAAESFGLIPLLVGTCLIMFVAMCVAGPIGLYAAIYMSEYASPRFRSFAKPALEILAGVPTVVFGFFAALTVAPFVRDMGQSIGLNVAAESALAAGLVMGVMIIPFISSLADDVINAVPQSLRDGSYGLGATKSETIKRVVLPAALPGIVSAFMLAISRAVGETMIVVMAAGLAANLTLNPLEAVTTITVQIKNLLVGDQEFDSAKTLSAFALGFVLFVFTLILNIIALRIVKRYREAY
jgi:phosphate transport system permease protein